MKAQQSWLFCLKVASYNTWQKRVTHDFFSPRTATTFLGLNILHLILSWLVCFCFQTLDDLRTSGRIYESLINRVWKVRVCAILHEHMAFKNTTPFRPFK